jgi:hypothetical protein
MRRLIACVVLAAALAVPTVASAAEGNPSLCGLAHGMVFTFGAPPFGSPGAVGDAASGGALKGGWMGDVSTARSVACHSE